VGGVDAAWSVAVLGSSRRPELVPSGDEAPRAIALLAEWAAQCASLRIAVRDGEGRFVATGSGGVGDPSFFANEERRSVIGSIDWPTMRYLDVDGRELRLLDHPAHVARLSGQPQIGKMIGLRAPDGGTRWYFGDYIPMNPSGAGYEVVSVIMDVTENQLAHLEQEARARALEVLLDTSLRLSRTSLDVPAIAAELRDACDAIVPRTHCGLGRWDAPAGVLRASMIAELPGLLPIPASTPFTAELRALLSSTYVNNDLQLTDILGTRVVGSDEVPARSVCAVPIEVDGCLVGAFAAYSQAAGYFDDGRVELLERLSQVVAPALARIAPAGAHGVGASTRP
jgi:hypothetical protein